LTAALTVPTAGGLLPVDKPPGPTSHDIVAVARRTLGTRKVGHAGTLDPFASGLLLLCVGQATRLAEYLLGLDKEYVATARLGVRTSTLDPEGEVVDSTDAWSALSEAEIQEALEGLKGDLLQRPPAYSAKKVAGQPAHRIVRGGGTVDLEPAPVTVHEIELAALELPHATFRVRCSSGTYVRALARDLGEALGVGAHLVDLRRTRIGSWDVQGAVDGRDLAPGSLAEAWIEPAEALVHLPRVEVGEEDVARLATGQGMTAPEALAEAAGPVAVVHGNELVAVATVAGGRLRPRKVFVRP
jgi:tRNA pseudouridine55 synthase